MDEDIGYLEQRMVCPACGDVFKGKVPVEWVASGIEVRRTRCAECASFDGDAD